MNAEQPVKQTNVRSNQQMWKLAIIALIILLLMIPVAWISSIIRERYQRKQSVIEEISGKWGGAQIVSGPFISVPYTALAKSFNSDNKEVFTEQTKYIYIAPDSLKASGKIHTVMHKRGIFKVTGYKAELDLDAVFPAYVLNNPALMQLPLRWEDALVSFDLDDQRGMKEIKGKLNGQTLIFNRSEGVLKVSSLPETTSLKDTFSGYKGDSQELKSTEFKLEAKVPVDCRNESVAINIQLLISGTQQLNFASSAMTESVNLEGDWQSPSFIGDQLPESRTVDSKGFKATWHTNNLSSGIKKIWTSDEPMIQLSNMGVNFLIMVDSYQQSTRALKYSVLFLLLTFMTFFFAETMSRQRIHPIQYLMVGCGLLVFYLLLLSISEHIAFAWSYLIAASGVILQISLYCYSILKTRKFALQVGALLIFLYIFLYVLLRLQDSALLIGSVSLFILLSLAMYIIRNINWYNQE
jgi:inner membrane protein